jgi:hypothetical protein
VDRVVVLVISPVTSLERICLSVLGTVLSSVVHQLWIGRRFAKLRACTMESYCGTVVVLTLLLVSYLTEIVHNIAPMELSRWFLKPTLY